jgi:hypothetical protein
MNQRSNGVSLRAGSVRVAVLGAHQVCTNFQGPRFCWQCGPDDTTDHTAGPGLMTRLLLSPEIGTARLDGSQLEAVSPAEYCVAVRQT